ncbi:MAG: hypothetical protein OXC07_13250 [Kistimonas sp.]|nr:hypothetical protein [Kistimonas sp.]
MFAPSTAMPTSKYTATSAWIRQLWLYSGPQGCGYAGRPRLPAGRKRLLDCAQHFTDRDLPRRRLHPQFYCGHRASLRQLFAENCSLRYIDENKVVFGGRYGSGLEQAHINFFIGQAPQCGLRNLDPGELIYFH